MARGAWRLSGYRIEELIGAGSSGEVWRARVASTGVPVALKRIWLSERACREDALSEAAMLSALDHPHLMALHDVRSADDAIVLVLDLAAGGSLADLLARRGRLTVGETITAISPIAAALAYAHNAGVVHGDVSAANILFTDIGLPLLADLGVARLTGDLGPVRTTPAYVDPVVAAGGLPSATSDVFMLAGVALHALTGVPPWPGSDPDQVLEAAMTGDQPDFAARMTAAGVPRAVAAVVAGALTVDPAYRATAADFALDLRHADEPVAVELRAGRSAPAAPAPESWPLKSVPVEVDAVPAGASRSVRVPPFSRLPLTHGVRAPSPFTGTAPGRHLARGSRPRVALGVAAAALALAAAVGAAVALWPRAAEPASGAAGDTAAPTAGVPALRSTPGRATAPSRATAVRPAASQSPPPSPPARLTPLAMLHRLDATRAVAFASRDPSLLSAVYASPQLLARDRALLLAVVPPGCGLHGLHTSFTRLVVAYRSAERVRVRLRQAVAGSKLVCNGVASGVAPGSAAVDTEVTLVRDGSRFRIESQHLLEV
jgi:hypothetical protein